MNVKVFQCFIDGELRLFEEKHKLSNILDDYFFVGVFELTKHEPEVEKSLGLSAIASNAAYLKAQINAMKEAGLSIKDLFGYAEQEEKKLSEYVVRLTVENGVCTKVETIKN